jgi:hypothetical protein
VEVAVEVWNSLFCFAVLPDKGQILHLLWAFYFMKCYPTEETACAAAGKHAGVIDPKTKIHLAIHRGHCQLGALCCHCDALLFLFLFGSILA